MAITAETRNSIIELVVTAYDAAPGTTLLTELITIINEGGTLADVATELTTSDQWNATYPIFQTAEEFAAEWLGKLLAEADADTLALAEDIVVGLINDGASAADLIMVASDFLAELDVEDELLGSSAAGFANKVEVATYFTVTLEQDGTQDELAAAIAGVSSDEDSVDAGKEEADSVGTPGTTFTLTKDVDDITGSAGDDTITAEPGTNATTGAATTTINSGDAIDGAGGDDTLNITVTASNNNSLSGLSVSNVEVVNITNANNIGGNSGAIESADEAVTDAQAAEDTAVAAQAIADAKLAAATQLDVETTNLDASGAATGADGSAEDLALALTGATLASVTKQQKIHDYIVDAGLDASSFAGITAINALTSTDLTGVTAFTLAELQAVANAALSNLDGSTSTSAADDADIAQRYTDIAASDASAYALAQATTGTQAGLGASAAALTAVAGLAGVSADHLTLSAVSTPAESAAQLAAFTALDAAGVATEAEVDAILASTTAITGQAYDLADYQAAAALLLKDEAGAATTATTAVTAVTETSTIEFAALLPGQSITINGVSVFSTEALTAAQLAEAFFTDAAPAGTTGVTVSGTWDAAKFAVPTAVEVFTVDFSGATIVVGDTITFDGDTTAAFAGAETAAEIAAAVVAASTGTTFTAVDNGDGTATFTGVAATANGTARQADTDFTYTNGGGGGVTPAFTTTHEGVDIIATSAVAGNVTDIAITGVAGYEVADVTTTQGVAGVTGESIDDQVVTRLASLLTAATAVDAGIGAALAAGTYTAADVSAAISAASVGLYTGTALDKTEAAELAEIGANATALAADATAAAAFAADDFSISDLTGAAADALESAAGTSLLTSIDDSAAIIARGAANVVTLTTVATDAATATAAAAAATAAAENTAATFTPTNGTVSAATFSGAEQIWLKGASNSVDVTGATTQTIGLSSLSSMDNSIAFGSASGSVYIAGSSGDLEVTGAKALSLSGTTGTVDLTAASSTSVDIDMSGANTLDLSAATALTSVTVSGEGASTLTLGAKVKTLTSTDGAVTATISTATVVDSEATTTVDETVSASVTTADGADSITVDTTGTGTTTVSTGDGDDTIVIGTTKIALNARDSIDGGEGSDTLVLAGATWTAQDYVVLDAAVSGIEVVTFTSSVTADASELGFPVIAMVGGGTLTEASGASLITWNGLTASSTGYDDEDADEIVYGGDLAVTATGGTLGTTKIVGGGTLTLNASSASVTVAATSNGDITSTIAGDLETLTLTTANSVSTLVDELVTVTITVTASDNEALTSVDLNGNGSVIIDSSAAADGAIELATIDASDLGGTLAKGTSTAGNITGGLTIATNQFIAETVMLGSGTDVVTANSTYENMDTISGADFVKETDEGEAAVANKSTTDTIILGTKTLDGSVEDQATEITLTAGATTLGLAFVEAAEASGSGTVYFHFGGDTYVYQDGGDDELDDSDLAVKIVGIVDLDTDWGLYQG
jgi:hypothetical protein